jgi:hypothetical protein
MDKQHWEMLKRMDRQFYWLTGLVVTNMIATAGILVRLASLINSPCGKSAAFRGWHPGLWRRCSCRRRCRPTMRGRRRAPPSVPQRRAIRFDVGGLRVAVAIRHRARLHRRPRAAMMVQPLRHHLLAIHRMTVVSLSP